MNNEYEFTLVLSDVAKLDEDFENAVYRGKCDDCLISSSAGRVVLTFTRSAESLKDAVRGAIADFRASGLKSEITLHKLVVEMSGLFSP